MTEDQSITPQPQSEIKLEAVEGKPELEKVEKSKKLWTCPECGKTYTYKYKYSHESHCHGKPKLKDIQKAKEAAKQLDSKPKSELLSERFEKPAEDPEVREITDDPKLNFYLQIAIVVGIVVTSLWVVYKSITNSAPQPQYEQQVDLGFTDARGVYYGPGEYHH